MNFYLKLHSFRKNENLLFENRSNIKPDWKITIWSHKNCDCTCQIHFGLGEHSSCLFKIHSLPLLPIPMYFSHSFSPYRINSPTENMYCMRHDMMRQLNCHIESYWARWTCFCAYYFLDWSNKAETQSELEHIHLSRVCIHIYICVPVDFLTSILIIECATISWIR